jgi:capsular exopolysaccharide synthesis family protein
MSRVNEARRRAAEAAAEAQAGNPPVTSTPIDDAAPKALASEPFPIEMAEHRRQRAPSPAPQQVPVPDPSSAPAREVEAGNARTIFERIDRRLSEKIVIDRNIKPTSREQYRRLAAVLHDAQAASGVRVVMIASAAVGEGKTLTASNLSLTFSESYRKRVLLIDADLRKPALHNVFRIDTSSGLSDGLTSPAVSKLTVRQVSERLAVLPAGRPSTDPMEGLISDRMRRLIDEAKETFDWVIIDTPPLELLPDTHLLASMVDGVVMVIRADSTAHNLVKRAVDAIGRARILGVVLNHAQTISVSDRYHDYYYDGQEQALERI